ncbi:hypothetical protein ACVIGB_000029 [Bradyrhizobium sp. USDA 4341]
MSDYPAKAINPATRQVEGCLFLDDHFSKNEYGVRFADGTVYRPWEVHGVDTKLTEEEAIDLMRRLGIPGDYPALGI